MSDVLQFSLLHITLFKPTSVQSTSVPQPVGYECLSSVFVFYVSLTACQPVCLSHQRDLHLLRLVTLLLLSSGVLFGWRGSRSHLQRNIINVNFVKQNKTITEMPYFSLFDKQHIFHYLQLHTNLLSPQRKKFYSLILEIFLNKHSILNGYRQSSNRYLKGMRLINTDLYI